MTHSNVALPGPQSRVTARYLTTNDTFWFLVFQSWFKPMYKFLLCTYNIHVKCHSKYVTVILQLRHIIQKETNYLTRITDWNTEVFCSHTNIKVPSILMFTQWVGQICFETTVKKLFNLFMLITFFKQSRLAGDIQWSFTFKPTNNNNQCDVAEVLWNTEKCCIVESYSAVWIAI